MSLNSCCRHNISLMICAEPVKEIKVFGNSGAILSSEQFMRSQAAESIKPIFHCSIMKVKERLPGIVKSITDYLL